MSKEIKSDVAKKPQIADKTQDHTKSKGLRNSIVLLLFFAISIAIWQWYKNNEIKTLPQEFNSLPTKIDEPKEDLVEENDTSIKNQLVETGIDTPIENKVIEPDTSSINDQMIGPIEEKLAEIDKRLIEIESMEERLVEIESIEKQLAEIDPSNELQNISNIIKKNIEQIKKNIKQNNSKFQSFEADLKKNIKQNNSKFQSFKTDLTESIGKQKVLEDLYRDLAFNHNETTIEEAEQLLLIANYQLRIANNIETTLVAMQEAKVRLSRINHPKISYLQEILVKDMDLLKSTPKIDIINIGLRLDNLTEIIDQLPLAMERPLLSENKSTLEISDTSMISKESQPAESILKPLQNLFNDTPKEEPISEGIFKEFLREIWTDIKKFINFKELIRIDHVGKQDIPPPSHSYFLRENLKLRLLSAHNALIARDSDNFKAYIKTSIEWVNKHFNNKSEIGISMLETLKQLHEQKITITAPNISASYDAVRQFRISTKRETANKLIDSKMTAQKRAEIEAKSEEAGEDSIMEEEVGGENK